MPESCPRCGHTEFYVVDQARMPNYEYSNSAVPMTLTAHYGDTGKKGLLGSSSKERVGVEMSARVCGGCGVISWFVRDMAQLSQFAQRGWGGVRGPE